MANLVADARALSAGQYLNLIIYGSTAPGDGGGGSYVWNAAETAADDGAVYIKPDAVDGGSPGRWVRVWSAPRPPRVTVIETGTSHTNAAADRDRRIRFTNSGAKTYVISTGIALADDVWIFHNGGGTGNIVVSADGTTLTGNLVFAPGKGGMIWFTSTSAADVIGGSAT